MEVLKNRKLTPLWKVFLIFSFLLLAIESPSNVCTTAGWQHTQRSARSLRARVGVTTKWAELLLK